MSRYAVRFNKTGYIKYTSHLDLLRLFKRVIKRCDIKLKYSQGFNPHPKLGFAQPLSLGYESTCEILEIETVIDYETTEIIDRLSGGMPEGIEITGCDKLPDEGKTLASKVYEAEYLIMIPLNGKEITPTYADDYLSQEKISAMKKQKKTKKLKEIDIRPMIKDIELNVTGDTCFMNLKCDCGSDSNLSPELVITTFLEFAGIPTERAEIEVLRRGMKIR